MLVSLNADFHYYRSRDSRAVLQTHLEPRCNYNHPDALIALRSRSVLSLRPESTRNDKVQPQKPIKAFSEQFSKALRLQALHV